MAGDTDGERSGDDVAESGGLEGALGRHLLPGFVRRRYAAKFALSLLVVLLVVGGLGAVSYVQIQGIIEDDAERTLESTATLQADSVSEWIAGMRVQTRAVGYADVFASDDVERIRPYLQESVTVGGGDVVALHYVDPAADVVVASTDQSVEGKAPSAISPALDAPIARASDDPGTVGTSETAYERGGNLTMAFAVETARGDGVLVLVGDVARDFEQLHRTGTVVTTRVLDADGKGVLAPRRNNPSGVSDTEAFERARAGETTTIDQRAQVVALAPVPDAPWVVTTTAPKSELYRASTTVGRNVIVLVTASLVVLGVVGIVVGRQTVVPLVRLRQRAEGMEAGDLDVDLRTGREDEIGRLFDSFSNMRDALRTQIEEAEQARREAEASRRHLVRQNERLDQFASTLSHDLRNPLTVARGNLELLATAVEEQPDGDGGAAADGDPSAPHQLVDRIDRAHDRMDAIIDDVLALARDGEQVGETTATTLESVASEAWRNVDTADATLSVTGSRTIDADRGRLLRAFENLFRNSVEHADSTVTVEVGLTGTGFYVADDGPGIPADRAPEVFEYGQTSSDSGTGLGLSIVETIAQAHGWTVAVDITDDTGAKFIFSDVFAEETSD